MENNFGVEHSGNVDTKGSRPAFLWKKLFYQLLPEARNEKDCSTQLYEWSGFWQCAKTTCS